jgi:hypothetical protein
VGAEGADQTPSPGLQASTKQKLSALALQSLSKPTSWVAKPEVILASLQREGLLSAAEYKIVSAILQQDKMAGSIAYYNEYS